MKFDWKNPWFVIFIVALALLLTACSRKEVDPGQETEVQSCIAKLHETKNFSKDTVIACQIAARGF